MPSIDASALREVRGRHGRLERRSHDRAQPRWSLISAPARVEPANTASEANALSAELRGQIAPPAGGRFQFLGRVANFLSARMSLQPFLTSLFPDTTVMHSRGVSIGDIDLREVVETYGMPLYLYDEVTLLARCREAADAFDDGVAST